MMIFANPTDVIIAYKYCQKPVQSEPHKFKMTKIPFSKITCPEYWLN